MPDQVKFGIVGAGAVAQTYARAFERLEDARIVAVSDLEIEAATVLARDIGCASYDCIERMMAECDLEAAIVCTPPSTHPEICIRLAECNIGVLCEKPFSIAVHRAEEMLSAARKSGVILAMASKFRYVEDVMLAKSMVSGGDLGEIIAIENTFTARIDMASRWNSMREISGGGVLIDNGTHSVDIMRYLVGPPAEVHAMEGKRIQGLGVEETVILSIRSISGVLCTVDLSWSLDKKKKSYLEIYGTKGAMSLGWTQSVYSEYSSGKSIVVGNGYNKIKAFRGQVTNFSRAVRGEENLSISGEDAIASVKTVQLAYDALCLDNPNVFSTLVRSPADDLATSVIEGAL